MDYQNNILYLHCFDNPNIFFMGKIDLKKAREVLPYGSVNKISERTGICKCEISRTLNGFEGKSRVQIEKEVLNLLHETAKEIDTILLKK